MKRLIGAMLLLACVGATRAAGPPDAATWARFGKVEEARLKERHGISLYRAGKFAEAINMFAEVLETREGLYPRARYPKGHPDLSLSLNNLAGLHQAQGDYAKAEPLLARALVINEALYSRDLFPQGHPYLATSLNNLAGVHQAHGDYAKAEPLFRRALGMREALYPRDRFPQGHPDLADSLNNLAFLYRAQSDYAKAGPLFRLALGMNEGLYPRARYPQGHPDLFLSLNNLAFLHQAQSDNAKAEPLYARALEMCEGLYPRARYPKGHPDLAISLNNLAVLHQEHSDYVRAEPLFARALEMYEGLYSKAHYPQGHPHLVGGLNSLADLHKAQGDNAKAEPLYARALEMCEGLYPTARYPQGHPHLAGSLNSLAILHQAQSDYTKSGPLFSRVLEMYEAMYPKARYPQGHPALATSLNNLAELHKSQGEYTKAEPLLRRALQMREALYPKARYPQGHPDLAQSLNNLATLHESQTEYAQAELLYRRSLEMHEAMYPTARYPQGHPHLAGSLSNLAYLHKAQEEYAKAEPLLRRALQMHSNLATSLAASSSEATALNYAASNPLTRDGYLSTTTHLPKVDVYPAVWQTKAALARVYERRHLAVLAASSKEARELWDAILSLKRQREALLLAPADSAKAKARDKRLDEIEEDIRKKEAALLPFLPAMKRSDDLAISTPADLSKALATDMAFIDFVRYVRFTQDPKVPGEKGEKRTPHYVAFVVSRVGVTRVELGKAEPIEEAFGLWRRALVEGSPSEPKYASVVHSLIWSPLVKHLPAKTSAVFVSPDAALNKLPWAALRDAKTNRILIEEYAVAVMPHGPMLLDRLTEPKRKSGTGTLLAMGCVVYDKEPKTATELALLRSPVGDAITWSALAGTAKELTQVIELAGKRKVIRREGTTAGAPTILADLPQAETAHLATHGFFADAKFRTAMQFDEKLFRRMGNERNTVGSRSPLVLSGIVCSGANLPGTPNRGVLTAEAIVGLDLRKMNLAVLSACETGLGDVAGGEGVYGLARAFHVAGTRNVVASLWKVDDEATAALMVLFYSNLWGKEKVSPMEAMRRAQLSVYRDPGKIKEWSQGRGPNLRVVIDGGKAPALTKGATTAPARAWAAFVLSGPGD